MFHKGTEHMAEPTYQADSPRWPIVRGQLNEAIPAAKRVFAAWGKLAHAARRTMIPAIANALAGRLEEFARLWTLGDRVRMWATVERERSGCLRRLAGL